ncbi:MAG: proteasome accessory factor PafA2 family protein [Actinomycetaceae bacterium]|nr:proteasome accessory factor PafA2 family protein [Actinomycetaceae bacterium]
MNRRIFGIETEYGITCAGEPGKPAPLDAEHAAELLFQPLVNMGRSTNVYWRNGGRVYLDVGAHPEFATAECDTIEDLLLQVRAGQELFADFSALANTELKKREVPGTIHMFSNNEDAAGNSFGCHENYLLRRSRNFREVADALVSFFVTRQIVTGSGHIHREGEPRMGYSPRATHMDDAVSAATTRSRPIINTRDEPLADAGEYRRLHVIVGDTNVSESSTGVKVAMTHLILSAVENGVRIADLALKEPMEAIRAIDEHLGANPEVELEDGRWMTPVQIQRELKKRALAVVDVSGADPLMLAMLDLWDRALDAVESGDHSGVDTELDWAIKERLINRFTQRSGASLDDPRVARLELAYHDITGNSLQKRMEGAAQMVRLTDAAAVEQAKSVPPKTTRAHVRGNLIAAAEEFRRDLSVDWLHLRLDDHRAPNVILSDPFTTSDPGADKIMELIREQDTGAGMFA